MALNYFKVLVVLGALSVGAVKAQDTDYLTIKSVKISRIDRDVLNQNVSKTMLEKNMEREELMSLPGMPNKSGQVANVDVGRILSLGRELVALGEDIYRLVQKGKPVNKTSYAPISVIPRLGNGYVDIFDTEGWKMPTKATYEI